MLLSRWTLTLQKCHCWGARPLPNTLTAFKTNSQHPLILHPLSDINAIPLLRVQTPKPHLAVELPHAEPVLLCPWCTAALHFVTHSCTSVHFEGFCTLSYNTRATLSPSTFSLLQDGWEEAAERSFSCSMRELGSQAIEKKRQQQSKAAASPLGSPVPTQV